MMRISLPLLFLIIATPVQAEKLRCSVTRSATVWPDGLGTFPMKEGASFVYTFTGNRLTIEAPQAHTQHLACSSKGPVVNCSGTANSVTYFPNTGMLKRMVSSPKLRFKVYTEHVCRPA
jgi:hypothetical protein